VEHLQRYPTRSFFFVWEKILLTAMANLSKPRLAKCGMNFWHKRRLSGAFVDAQAVLGECMFAAALAYNHLTNSCVYCHQILRDAESLVSEGAP
jgi:hypothetical protein